MKRLAFTFAGLLAVIATVACSATQQPSLPITGGDRARAARSNIVPNTQISPPPSGVIQLSGQITGLITGGFTIHDAHAGYMHVYTNSSTAFFGAKPAVGLYSQAVGTGSFATSETATFVSDWSAAPTSMSATGTVAASTAYGFTLHVDSSHSAVPVAWYTGTVVPSPVNVGSTVTVTGTGSISQAAVASEVQTVASTPAPSPTPTLSPTPAPTSGPGTILGDTTGKFNLIQILDRRMSQTDIQNEASHEATVWGSFQPQYWNQYHPNMYVSMYVIPFNDVYAYDDTAWNHNLGLVSGHTLSWWQANHNDWIMYACDSNGNPTTDVPQGDGFPDVPLAYWNPSVIQYQMNLLVPWMVQHGFNTLSIDQVTFYNYLSAPNQYLGEGSPHPGWYACGSYSGTNGSFVKRYTYGWDKQDPQFIADVVNWVKSVRQILTTDPTLSQYHIKLIVNHPLPGSSTIDQNEQTLVANVDGIVNEDGISNYDRYGVYFPNYILYMQYAQSHHVAFWDVDYFCQNSGQQCESALTTQQLEFAMAAHQLGNEGGAGLYVSPSTGDIYSYHSQYQAQLGTPCGEYAQVPNTTYMYSRRFSNGFVVVNNNASASQSISLPTNHVYTDVSGRSLANPLTLLPHDGYVLTTSGNGCQ